MKNIKAYCDCVYSFIRECEEQWDLCEDCEEYINHLHWDIELAEDILGNKSSSTFTEVKVKPFKGDIQLAQKLGQQFYLLREKCINGIEERLFDLSYSSSQLKEYTKDLLKTMWNIQLNYPIGKKAVFKEKIIPEVFIPIIELLREKGINVDKILLDWRKKKGDGFCSWISLKETGSKDKPIDKEEAFRNLFKEEYCKYIESFIQRLEENGIIKDGMFIYSKKNYLAKLFVFMKSKGFIISQKYMPDVKFFYEYFGFTVCEKIEDKRNGVTIRNLTTVCNKGVSGLSGDEKNLFNLICSVFVSERK